MDHGIHFMSGAPRSGHNLLSAILRQNPKLHTGPSSPMTFLVRALLPPMTFTDVEAVMGDVPSLGQHTDEVLHELGYSTTEVARLRQDAVV